MKKVSLIFFLVCSLQMLAQQDPQYSLYMFNGLSINPAYAGSDNGWVANLNYRNQWV